MTDFHVGIIHAMLISQSLEDFCENLVANFWDAGIVRGVDIYTRRDLGTLALHHNISSGDGGVEDTISLDLDNCRAISYRRREVCRSESPSNSISAPIEFQGLLLGAICLTFVNADALKSLSDDQMKVIAAAVSGFLDPKVRAANKRFNRSRAGTTPSELSVRQLQILQRMAEGQLYSQIARTMHISESLVKLEASRVFKYLGVAKKQDAIEAGRKLFLAPPPPRELTGSLGN